MSRGILDYRQYNEFFDGGELSGEGGLVSTDEGTSMNAELDIKVYKS